MDCILQYCQIHLTIDYNMHLEAIWSIIWLIAIADNNIMCTYSIDLLILYFEAHLNF